MKRALQTCLALAALLTCLLATGAAGAAGAASDPARSRRQEFKVNGRAAFIITPVKKRPGPTPWVFYAPTFNRSLPGGAEHWMFARFLDAGIAIAGVDVGESYGSPAGRATYTALHKQLTSKQGFADKACLLARSRGGLMLYCWAAENPDKVSGIAGIYPVCNIASYPGVKRACGAYGLTAAELTAELDRHNPIDRLAPLARAGVPIYHIHGDVDKVVPLDANSALLAERYKKLGGKMQLNIVKGQGHNMWKGFFECQPLVDFVIANATSDRSQNYGNVTELTPSIPQYFSWINNTNEGATEAHTLINLEFFKWLHDEYGMKLGIYAWDAGNLDSQRYYGSMKTAKFKKQFPNGWGPSAKLARSFGCRLGIWGGPDGFGDTPAEEKARTDMLVEMVRDYHVQLFKFDAVCGQLRDEKQGAFANAMSQCRKIAPDLIVLNHRLNLGQAKPHATTFLWGGAETYIDVHMTNRTTGTHNRVAALSRGLPPELKRLTEDHGVCLSSCLDFWEDDLVLQAFNRSLILAPETYGNPWLLRDDEFPKLARIHNLHYRNRDILVRGMVLPESAYGPHAVARGDAKRRFITLRNLAWQGVTYKVKLDEEIGLAARGNVELRRYHPSESIIGTYKYGQTVNITVDPFRSCLLLATVKPIGEIGIEGSDYEIVRDTKGKDAIVKVLGLPGTSATIKVKSGGRKFTRALLDGKPAGEVLDKGLVVTFAGKKLTRKWHRKLADLKDVDVPADAEALYEATCFSAQNTALEVQSAVRSGATEIPQVKAARDAFFGQELFWRRGISDRYMFDGKDETFFGAFRYSRDRRLSGGALRVDLHEPTAYDRVSIKTLWNEDEKRPAPDSLSAEFSSDLKSWTSLALSRDKAVSGKVKIAEIRNNGGKHELVDADLVGWAASLTKAGPYRFMRIVSAPGRVAELQLSHKGKTLTADKWTATNLFAPYETGKAVAAWQATVDIDADAPDRAYLCVALDGEHGTNKAFAALRVAGKLIGAAQRAPSFPAVVFEYGPSQRSKNNTYFFPVTEEIRGKRVDVVIVGLDKGKTDFQAQVWTTGYPNPCKSMELILKE